MDDAELLMFLRAQRERRLRDERRCNSLRLRRLRDASDPFSLSEDVFKGLYRFSQDMLKALLEELRPNMVAARSISAIPAELKVLCALHFYAQGSYQKSVGSDSNLGLCQSSVSYALEEVTAGLNSNNILRKWIPFPRTEEERRAVIRKNFLSSQIPGVLGYIDGTHIAINAPAEDENLFYNRKAFHSINSMIICDSDMKIMYCFNGFGGCTHDAYIWNESPIKRDLMGVWASGEQCWLLGDSGYPHQPWLQTPILNARAGSPEARYTAMHIRARSKVERCIGLLKGRFRCLLRSRTLEYAPVKCGRIINAAVVLHNMCITGGLPEVEIPVEEDAALNPLPQEEVQIEDLLQEARVVRERIINRLNV